MHTNDCRNSNPNSTIINYVDYSAIVDTISNDNSNDYLTQISYEKFFFFSKQRKGKLVTDLRVMNRISDPVIVPNKEVG